MTSVHDRFIFGWGRRTNKMINTTKGFEILVIFVLKLKPCFQVIREKMYLNQIIIIIIIMINNNAED